MMSAAAVDEKLRLNASVAEGSEFMMGDFEYGGELYDVLVSGDGATSPIMEEIVPGVDFGLIDGRVFCVPEDEVDDIIYALFERKYGSFNSSDKEQARLRTCIKTRLYNYRDGLSVAFDAEIADLFSLGKYGFSDIKVKKDS